MDFDTNIRILMQIMLLQALVFLFNGIAWTRIDNRYLWDGALLSNTPLREVIDASPISDKMVYLVNIFPHSQKRASTRYV